MTSPTNLTRSLLTSTLAATLLLTGAACGTDDAISSSSHPITLDELNVLVATGPTFVEIELVPGTLTASEVHVEAGEDEEKIVSEVASIDAATGTLTLALGNLAIGYGDGTRFRTESESHEDRAAWEAAVAAGSPVEIRRDLPAAPQAPADATFVAVDLRLEDESDEPKIEILIGVDNLEVTGPSDAILRVLGLEILISSSTSLNEDSSSSGPGSGDEFEAAVTSADLAAGTLTLADGTIVDVSSVTFDPAGDLFDLSSVADAVASSAPVRAEGRGSAAAGGAIVATELKVEVDD